MLRYSHDGPRAIKIFKVGQSMSGARDLRDRAEHARRLARMTTDDEAKAALALVSGARFSRADAATARADAAEGRAGRAEDRAAEPRAPRDAADARAATMDRARAERAAWPRNEGMIR
jgi:hypothetical protein